MKTKVDIISGFLDSGKTTFINLVFRTEDFAGERIVIIQSEAGEIEIDDEITKNKWIYLKTLAPDQTIDTKLIHSIMEKHYPDRIIIELNGMSKIETLLIELQSTALRKKCIINKIINTIDISTFEVYMNNMASILVEQISNSDLIVLNKVKKLPDEKIKKIEHSIQSMNRSAKIVRTIKEDETTDKINFHKDLTKEKRVNRSKMTDNALFIFFGFILIYFIFNIIRSMTFNGIDTSNIDLSRFQSFNTVFMSILMQAFPFILVGVFVSSVIQVFVPGETVVKLFPTKLGLGFIAAIFAGVFFPVCDCAIVPVASRLVKKGVSLPVAITFMLSAPIVNPIVIASTLYAFPGQSSIAAFRVYFGITIAFVMGMTLLSFHEDKTVLLDKVSNFSCNCGFCNDSFQRTMLMREKIQSIFTHAVSEFFGVGKFLIIGAFISSIMQTFVPKDLFGSVTGNSALSLFIMMLAAFVFSVCSTSDAFIARSFMNQFQMASIMGFLVLGPMIDIKNMLMLFSSFRKEFVVKLVILLFVISFLILFVFTQLYFKGGLLL